MANKLVLELLADSDPLLKSLDQSQRQLNNFIKSSESAGQALGGGVNRALDIFTGLAKGGGAAAGVLAGGFVAASVSATALVEHAGKQAEALEQLSQKTGISTGIIQQWSVIMAQSGLGAETLTRGVKQLSEQIIQARNPNSQAAETFSELGITATSVNGVIEQVADHFVGMADGADKTRLAVMLFGKAGQDLIPTLNQGSAGFRQSMEASKQLGAVLSESTLHALSSADDAFDRLGVATSAASNQLAGVLAPAVTSVTNLLTDGVSVVARYFQALNEGVSKGNSSSSGFSKWAELLKAVIAPTIVTIPQHLIAAKEKMDEIANRTEDIGVLADEHVQDLMRQAAIQEDMGRRILVDILTKWRLITAEQRAQEALGRTVNAIAERERKERNADFALRLQQQEDLNNLQFEPYKPSQAMLQHEAAVENLIRLVPELTHHEAALQVLLNQQVAHDVMVKQAEAQKNLNKELELGVQYAKADFDLQQAWYQRAPGLIGQADLARTQGLKLLEEETALRRRVIDQTIFDEERKGAAIFALDKDLQAKRIGIINQFPTFWEQQLSSIVTSSAFSLSSITSNFNNATAQWIQGQGDFTDFFKSTQTMMLNVGLQTVERWLAEVALAGLREMGLQQALDAAKVALGISTEAQKTAAAQAGASARAAIATEEAVAEQTIMAQTGSAVTTMWESVGQSTIAVGKTALEVLAQITDGVMGIIDAIADALTFTGILAPVGFALKGITSVLSGQAGGISDALGGFLDGVDFGWVDNIKEFFGFSSMVDLDAIPSVAFASGGIVTGPTLGLMGEAGSPEAAIPLNDRGAAFMQKTLGLGGAGGTIHVELRIDSKTIGEAILPAIPGAYKLHARGI